MPVPVLPSMCADYRKIIRNIEGCHEEGVGVGLGNQGDDQSGVLVICADLPHSRLSRIRQWLTRLPSNGVGHK